MNVRQRVALLLAGLALVVAGCTQPSAPGASTQPAASQGGVPATEAGPGASTQPAASEAPTPPGRYDY